MKKSEKIIAALLTMAIGILLIVLKNNFIGLLMTIAGVCLIAFGALDILHNEIPPAVIKLVVGALIIICGWVLVEAVLYIVAAFLLVVGILMTYDKLKKGIRCSSLLLTIMEYAVPILFIVIGVLLLFHQAFAIELIFIIAGILTLIEGGVLLTNTLMEDM